ncbi:MAG: hypothetical protein WCK37_05245 [Candidatus Falkowbacteria bacterium]
MNEQEEHKKKLILFAGTGVLMLVLLGFWIFNFQAFLSTSDKNAVKNGAGVNLFGDVSIKFSRSLDALKNQLDTLNKKNELAQQKAAAGDIKKFAADLEANLASSSPAQIKATSSSSTDFVIESMSSSSASSTISSSTKLSDAELKKIKISIEEINKKIQSNK